MQTPASISRHPVHPTLIVLPLGFWVFSLFCDLLYLGGAEAGIWSRLALYTMVGGFVGALAAVALSGFVDLRSLADRQVKRTGLTHLNLTLIVVALYAVNIWLRFSDPASLAIAIVLSAIGLGMLAVASWLGDEPVRVRREK
jgi:uncharacterized membrane protein